MSTELPHIRYRTSDPRPLARARSLVSGQRMRVLLGTLFIFAAGTFPSSCTDSEVTPGEPIGPSTSGPDSGMSGSQFLKRIRGMSKDQIETQIFTAARNGNIPKFMRTLAKVKLTGVTPTGKAITGSILVTPDYFSIGNNRDFVRVPMNPMTAQKIASYMGYVLPTTKVVDEIYRQATVHLKPNPLPPGPTMVSVNYFIRHNQIIERQLGQNPSRRLTAGHKKDIVLTNRLVRMPERVAIYGWHRSIGNPIQPLSTVHDNKYADYSHGVRLVWNMMEVNGKQMSVASVLQSSEYSSLLSNEGAIKQGKILMVGLSDEQLTASIGRSD